MGVQAKSSYSLLVLGFVENFKCHCQQNQNKPATFQLRYEYRDECVCVHS